MSGFSAVFEILRARGGEVSLQDMSAWIHMDSEHLSDRNSQFCWVKFEAKLSLHLKEKRAGHEREK